MSKFKVGDRVRRIDDDEEMDVAWVGNGRVECLAMRSGKMWRFLLREENLTLVSRRPS